MPAHLPRFRRNRQIGLNSTTAKTTLNKRGIRIRIVCRIDVLRNSGLEFHCNETERLIADVLQVVHEEFAVPKVEVHGVSFDVLDIAYRSVVVVRSGFPVAHNCPEIRLVVTMEWSPIARKEHKVPNAK